MTDEGQCSKVVAADEAALVGKGGVGWERTARYGTCKLQVDSEWIWGEILTTRLELWPILKSRCSNRT